MDDGDALDDEAAGLLAVFAVPQPRSLNDFLDRYNWSIRCVDELPDGFDTKAASAAISAVTDEVTADVRQGRGLPAPTDADRARALVRRIDSRHLVLSVDCVPLARDRGYEYLAASGAALIALDQMVPVSDVQGFPRRCWALLMGPSVSTVTGRPTTSPSHRYFKGASESDLGVGVCYLEVTNMRPTRQVQIYGDTWQWGDEANNRYLGDQPPNLLDVSPGNVIGREEFEEVWKEALRRCPSGS